MYVEQEDVFYYMTVENERSMPAMPEGVEEGILKGSTSSNTRVRNDPSSSTALWQRCDNEQSARGAADFRRAVRRRRGRVEHNQLQESASRCTRQSGGIACTQAKQRRSLTSKSALK